MLFGRRDDDALLISHFWMASVYLVREVLYDPDPADDDMLSPIDAFESFQFSPTTPTSSSRPQLRSWGSDIFSPPQAPTYGRNFALKCLCKKDLSDELVEVQRGEAVLHRALPEHEYIVRLYAVRSPFGPSPFVRLC